MTIVIPDWFAIAILALIIGRYAFIKAAQKFFDKNREEIVKRATGKGQA